MPAQAAAAFAIFLQSLCVSAVFVGCLGLSYWWIRPNRTWLEGKGAAVLWLINLTFWAGLFAAVALLLGPDPRRAPWLLPPLPSRVLAVAACMFAAVAFLAIRRPT